jgi:hypothetical protein
MRPRGRRCLGWMLATLTWALPAHAQGVAGIVLDPQDRRIVGASIVLTCAERMACTFSDAEGRFTFRTEAAPEGCALRVTARGFTPTTTPASPGADVTVRLTVAPVVETIEVRPRAVSAPMATAGVVVSREQMRTISDDPAEILRVAKARAGPAAGHAIYVDGLPAQQLPPVSRMASLAVATDPYSAEYSDPSLQRIDIVTLHPDRRWRVDFGGSPGTIDGDSPLGDRSRSRSLRGGVAGPSPWAGGAFSVHADVDELGGERAVVTATPGVEAAASQPAPYATSRRVISFQFHQALTTTTALRIEGLRTVDRTSGDGVGGEVLPEAGAAREGAASGFRVSVDRDSQGVSWRSQLLGDWNRNATRAASVAPALQVQGAFIGGGAPIWASTTNEGRLFWKTVVGSPAARAPWRVGLTVDRTLERRLQVPNTAGSVQLSSVEEWHAAESGAPVATVFQFTASSVQRVALLDAAAFAEAAFLQRPHLRLGAGARVDWQARDHVRLSPRLSAAGRHGDWTLSGGVGLFTQTWRPGLLLGTPAAEGPVPLLMMGRQVSLDSVTRGNVVGVPIVMDVTPGLTRARYLMTSQAAERPIGSVTIGVEHVWWRGRRLLGAERLPDRSSNGWTDWLESNRSSDSHEVRARISVGGRKQNASLTYSRMHSTDDTDGPWSFPARQGDIAAERARSSRLAADNLDAVVSASLRSVHVTAIASLRGASPYTIISGLDAEANGLYTDRGGLPRNSGRLPASRSLSLYLHRRFNLASVSGGRANLPVDGGLQVDNVLAGRVWTAVGNVAGSPLFGRPEGAMPGRSVRIWFALAQ